MTRINMINTDLHFDEIKLIRKNNFISESLYLYNDLTALAID
jgi:hypothetical protein